MIQHACDFHDVTKVEKKLKTLVKEQSSPGLLANTKLNWLFGATNCHSVLACEQCDDVQRLVCAELGHSRVPMMKHTSSLMFEVFGAAAGFCPRWRRVIDEA